MSTYRLNSVLNVKALVGAFNQEKALVGAFSVIVQLHRLIDLRHYTKTSGGTAPVPASSLGTLSLVLQTDPSVKLYNHGEGPY